jgi:hypothetical protein
MSNENIYSAPVADLTDAPRLQGDADSGGLKFYVVAPYKFILLYVCTLGFYKIYWFYKNWSRYKAYVKSYADADMWPVMRAIFSIFFVHALFRNVDETINDEPRKFSWSPSVLATLYVIFQLIITAIDRLPKTSFENIAIGVELALMVPIIGFVLFTAQRAINAACGDPKGESNNKLSVANWLWIVLGGICLALAVVGIVYT